MIIAVVGSGGREYALARYLGDEHQSNQIYVLPGNPGTDLIAENIQVDVNDLDSTAAAIQNINPDLIVVGPENPLAEGITDRLSYEGFKVFGPTAQGARIESDKLWAKQIMMETDIPTSKWLPVDKLENLSPVIESFELPVVIKASGLAGGKGVFIVKDKESAEKIGKSLLEEKKLGSAGKQIVIEECLVGSEASFFFITDGRNYQWLCPAQDYKRALDNDQGPNTGGMGAVAPVKTELIYEVEQRIVLPLLDYLRYKKIEYRGVIYIGTMIVDGHPKVLEFNCRFGDPETQVILPLVAEGLTTSLLSAAAGKLEPSLKFKTIPDSDEIMKSLGVVIASEGYPHKAETGFEITGVDELKKSDLIVHYAGVKKQQDHIINGGGRVFTVTGIGNNFKSIRENLYTNINRIKFKGAWYRKDIGKEFSSS
ncbi:MAG: phosphoribosylamine--glycine ligase [bacterium]